MKKVISIILAVCVLSGVMMLSGCAGFMPDDSEDSVFIKEIKKLRVTEDGEVEIGIYFTDEELAPVIFTIPSGAPGIQGEDGNGILDVLHEHDDELNKTKVTIIYTDENKDPYVFYINDGLMVEDIVTDTDDILGTFIQLKYNDDSVSEKIPLPKGDDGRGVKDMTFEVNEDKSVKIIFLLTDDTEEYVDIPAPQTGNGIESMSSRFDTKKGQYILDVQYTSGEKVSIPFTAPPMWYYGNSEPSESKGVVGDYFFDRDNKVIYTKVTYEVEVEGEDGVLETQTKTRWDILINFKDQLDTYNVTFHMNDGNEEIPATYRIKRGTYFKDNGYGNIPVPEREGYRFVGWYTQKTIKPENSAVMSPFTDLTAVFGNLDLYAIWVEE